MFVLEKALCLGFFLVFAVLFASPLVGQVVEKQKPPGQNNTPAVPAYPKAWSRPVDGSIMSDPVLLVRADEALDHLYNMRNGKADSIFKLIESRFPEHPIGPFLRSLTLWWQILPTLTVHDTSLDRSFLKEMDRVIDRSERLLRKKELQFDAMFFKTAAHGFRGRLLSDRESWLRAAQDGKSAMEHIFEIAEEDTLNADLLFGAGVYDYFAVVIPERYSMVAPLMLFFPDGNKERGLRRLETSAHYGRFVAAESAYFLLQIYSSFQPNYDKSIEYVSLLRERYPENALFHVLEGRILFRWGQWEQASAVFEAVVSEAAKGKTGYVNPLLSQAYYYLGRRDMIDGNDALALRHFQTAIALEATYPDDSFFRAHATLRSGMVQDRMGKRKEAIALYQKVLKIDNQSNSRERARRYLKTPYGGRTE